MSESLPRVLIVDDNATNQHVASLMLRRLGYAAVIVSGGYEALQQYAAQRFAAILMDCMMPDIDGYETTIEIRRIEQRLGTLNRTPIIAVTANATPGDRERCLAIGMDDYLAKPMRLNDLRVVVERWIGRRTAGEGVSGGAAQTAGSNP